MNELKLELSKFGLLQICKEGFVFTVLMTGKGFSSWTRTMDIQKLITDYAGEKYPIVECLRNDDDFFCIVLKPKSI